jgi:dihydrofolate reductase
LRIWHFPVVLGTGKRLFGEGTIPRAFRLVETQQIATGAVLHVYERAVVSRLMWKMLGRTFQCGTDIAA